MRAIFAVAMKDLRLLARNRATLFFTFIWPILMAIGFGLMFGGDGDRAKIRVLLHDGDGSAQSQLFAERLLALDSVTVERVDPIAAEQEVRRGRAVALINIPAGFGAASGHLFFGTPARVQVLIDPSRQAESGMLEGLLMQVASQDIGRTIENLGSDQQWLDSARSQNATLPETERARYDALYDALAGLPAPAPVDPVATAAPSSGGWKPLDIEMRSLQAVRSGPRNPFAITFPQGMLWGLVGCLMGFATGFAQEREKGTWLRLRTGPMTATQLMFGKALAALIALIAVQLFLLLVARIVFGLRPESISALLLVVAASAIAFTGLMLLISSAGRTTQGVSSAGWASMMPLMMIGGGMIPLIAMPAWMAKVSALSPVNWALRSMEGAIWRGYAWSDYVWPLAALVLLGVLGFVIGARRLSRAVD